MSPDTSARHPAARLIDALLSALSGPQEDELSIESQVLQHFPFARLGDEEGNSLARLRIPTTAHGSL